MDGEMVLAKKQVHEIKMQGKCALDVEEVMCLLKFK
jgi:hypothetical protein